MFSPSTHHEEDGIKAQNQDTISECEDMSTCQCSKGKNNCTYKVSDEVPPREIVQGGTECFGAPGIGWDFFQIEYLKFPSHKKKQQQQVDLHNYYFPVQQNVQITYTVLYTKQWQT